MTNTWDGDWRERIRQRVKELEYQDLIDFSERNSTADFFQLAELLGEQVAPIQVEQILGEEYYRKGKYTKFFRNSLARHIRNSLSQGWNADENSDLQRASAFTDWELRTVDEYADFTERIWSIFKNSNDIPNDWLPEDGDDPIIIKKFEEAGFQEVEINR